MIARRSPLLAGALVCGALITGCGSSSNSTTSGSTATTSSTAAAATTSTPSTTKSTAPVTGVSPADLAAAVAECKAVVQHSTTLSSSLKSKVEGICNKAASGNVAAARAAAKEVCVEVINATPVPAADKAQALAACKTS
jgi:hypothetical protein